MLVNELAKRSGIASHVVRYYARIGLLTPARDPENGYKLFNRDDVVRMCFIRQAQSLGFTLEEIQEILQNGDNGTSPCPMVRRTLVRRIDENRQHIEELLEKQQRMEQALLLWREMPDQTRRAGSVCHLIEQAAAARQCA